MFGGQIQFRDIVILSYSTSPNWKFNGSKTDVNYTSNGQFDTVIILKSQNSHYFQIGHSIGL